LGYPYSSFAGIDINYDSIRKARRGTWSISYDFTNFRTPLFLERFEGFKVVAPDSADEPFKPEYAGYYPLFMAKRMPGNVKFYVSDYERMFFEDESFDVVFAFNCGLFPWVSGYDDSKKDIMRVLRKGGTLLLNSDTIIK
jgi:SAM-dependent methyltransferase